MTSRVVRAARLAVLAAALSACAPPVVPAAELPAARLVAQDLHATCGEVTTDEGVDRGHVDAADAPPPAALYERVPPNGGRHYGVPHPLVVDADRVADVRATTHNLEHGAVVVHVDAARLGERTARDVEAWAAQLGDAGFRHADALAGILVVGMPRGATGDPVVSLRAWGLAVDCKTWDRATADGFVARSYGDRGVAPERALAPYPDDNGVLLDRGTFT